jgi:hypothetical protein
VVPLRQLHQWFAGFRLNVGGIDDRQMSPSESLGSHEVQDLERIVRRCLIVLVVADQSTAIIGRHPSVGKKFLRANVLFPDPLDWGR